MAIVVKGSGIGGVKVGSTYIGEVWQNGNKVWPVSTETIFTLENLAIHYSDDGYELLPTQENYAWLEADYVGRVGSRIVSSVHVTATPEYYMARPIYIDGDAIYWDRQTYGKTPQVRNTVEVYGHYNDVYSTTSATLNIGVNAATNSYRYDKSFTIPSLTGQVPASGGEYVFRANAQRTVITTYSSGDVVEGTTYSYECPLSVSGGATLSTSTVTGVTQGTITFPRNWSTTSFKDYTISMSNTESGTWTQVIRQAKQGVTYAFTWDGGLTETTFNIQRYTTYEVFATSTRNGSYIGATVQSKSPEITSINITQDGSQMSIELEVEANPRTETRTLNFVLVQNESGNVIRANVLQAAATEEYVFEFSDHTTEKVFTVTGDNYDVYLTSTMDGEYIGATWRSESPYINAVTISEEDGQMLVNVDYDENFESTSRDIDILLTQIGSHKEVGITLRQQAYTNPYVFEAVGSTEFNPTCDSTSVQVKFKSYRTSTMQTIPLSYSVQSGGTLIIQSVDYSWSGTECTATIHYPANLDAVAKNATITFSQTGTGMTPIAVTIEQQQYINYTYEISPLIVPTTIVSEATEVTIRVMSLKRSGGLTYSVGISNVSASTQDIGLTRYDEPVNVLGNQWEIKLYFSANVGSAKSGNIIVTQAESGQTLTIPVTREASQYISVNLNHQWVRDTTLDTSGLIGFKSAAGKGVGGSTDFATITFKGYTSFTIYLRSAQYRYELEYDYAILSRIDSAGVPTSAESTYAYASTKGYSSTSKVLSNYQKVDYNAITSTRESRIYAVYRKDSSDTATSGGTDEGFILLPNTATWSNPYE